MSALPAPLPGKPRAARVERRWRWPVVAAMLATIPAFYSELLESAPSAWVNLTYVVAAVVLAASVLHGGWRSGHLRRHLAAHAVDAVLVTGLLAAALVTASSHSGGALALRLLVAFMTLGRMMWALQHWMRRGGVPYLMGIAAVVLLLCGAGFWWLEPGAHTLADGLWLAFTTAATVGYGDIVPSTPASRIFSVFVVLLGYGVLSLVTAAIATAWIETEERRIERDILRDLHAQVGALRGEIAALREQRRGADDAPADAPSDALAQAPGGPRRAMHE